MSQNVSEPISREDFAEFLINMRNSANLGVREMAREIGTNHSNIRAWEGQRTFPHDVQTVVKKVREAVRRRIQMKRKLENVKRQPTKPAGVIIWKS